MLVVGGGIIGLEMGTVYSTLGARLDVVEMLDGLMLGADRDLVQGLAEDERAALRQHHAEDEDGRRRGDARTASCVRVRRRGRAQGAAALRPGAAGGRPQRRTASASAPRRPASTVSDRGFIPVDIQMRTNVPHIFAIGDIVGQPMLAHKAVHEAHVAAEVAPASSRRRQAADAFDARVIPSVAYTDPGDRLGRPHRGRGEGAGHQGEEGPVPVDGVGPRDRQRPRRRLHQAAVRRARRIAIVGGGIVGTHAGDMIGEIALAIEMGADAVDIGKTIHPHPTLGESIGLAAEAFEGVCTDLPPARR